jgi:iron complex outermembrane receptor protein
MFRYSPPAGLVRSTLLASAAVFGSPFDAEAQSERTNLPPVTVTAPEKKRAGSSRPPRNVAQSARAVRQARNPASTPQVPSDQGQGVRGALAVLSAQQALTEINQTPGGVAIVPAAAYKNSTVANTIKDVLDYVPGVFAQPKWGDDTRLSIRGSGLSRNFHLRGVQLYMDGIPINTADGYGDFQEIDPTAYKYVEVWKGANALQFGANSLGGAINFVMPTGRDPFPNGVSADIGAFGFKRLQANAGGANGPWDGFVTAATQASDGFRDHSFGSSTRVSGNVGYQFSPDAETRFYFNANEVRQRIPGTVTKQSALTNPEAAAPNNVTMDQQRNIDTVRLANKTTIRFEDTKVEFGAFGVDRHLMHPIFQWLDYSYKDYGGFAKVTDDRFIGGFRNRVVAGINILNGSIDNQQFANIGGQKGALLSSSIDRSKTPRSMSRTVSISCRTWPRLPARNSSTPPATGRIASSATAISRDRPSSSCGRRRPACYGISIRPGRPSPTFRAAPRCRVSAKARTGWESRSFPSPASARKSPPPMRSERG